MPRTTDDELVIDVGVEDDEPEPAVPGEIADLDDPEVPEPDAIEQALEVPTPDEEYDV